MIDLKASQFKTQLGTMIAISDERVLHLLEFVDRRGLEHQLERLRKKMGAKIVFANTPLINSIEREINSYFEGKLQAFETPLFSSGSPFQRQVWNELKRIPYGETRSYLDIAKSIGKPSACRAVARANSTNQFAVVIPCHRVINTSGELGGYAGGIERKLWLINHEKNIKRQEGHHAVSG